MQLVNIVFIAKQIFVQLTILQERACRAAASAAPSLTEETSGVL